MWWSKWPCQKNFKWIGRCTWRAWLWNQKFRGSRVLKLCAAADSVITNTYFTKCDSQLWTYCSGNVCSQIDYILVWKCDFKSVCDAKGIGSEECVLQHKLLVEDLELNTAFSKSHCIPPKWKLWELSDPEVCLQFGNFVHKSAQSFQNPQNSDRAWNEIKTCMLKASDTACGWTQGGKPRWKEKLWWNDVVDCAIKEKRWLRKEWEKGGDKEKFLQAKGKAKSVVYVARKSSQEARFGQIEKLSKSPWKAKIWCWSNLLCFL